MLVVHLVDMVAGQDHHVVRAGALDDVDVLVNGVGRAGIPLIFGDALAGGQDVEALVALLPEEVPAALKVPDQAVRLVLGGDADATDARIECVREGEIDDARLAAEVDRRFGAPVGQFHQAAAAPACQHIGHCGAGQRRAGPNRPVDRGRGVDVAGPDPCRHGGNSPCGCSWACGSCVRLPVETIDVSLVCHLMRRKARIGDKAWPAGVW